MKQSKIEELKAWIDSLPEEDRLYQSGKIEQELYKEWRIGEGFREREMSEVGEMIKLNKKQDREKKIGNQICDVSQHPRYQKKTDIDFEEIISQPWDFLSIRERHITDQHSNLDDVTLTNLDRAISYGVLSSVPEARLKHVEIKGSETVFNGKRTGRLLIETVSDIKKGLIGWYRKVPESNPTFQADFYKFILSVYNIDGYGVYTDKTEKAVVKAYSDAQKKKDFMAWKKDPDRRKDDRFITEAPFGLMISLSRAGIDKLIERYNITEDPLGNYKGYLIQLDQIEDMLISDGWNLQIPPAIPLVRYLTGESHWDGNQHGSKTFEGMELISSQYRYYIPRRLLYAAYGITETKLRGMVEYNDKIFVKSDSEIYERDINPVSIIGYGKHDGSLRKLSRIAMAGGIESWGELPAVLSGPVYQPIRPF